MCLFLLVLPVRLYAIIDPSHFLGTKLDTHDARCFRNLHRSLGAYQGHTHLRLQKSPCHHNLTDGAILRESDSPQDI